VQSAIQCSMLYMLGAFVARNRGKRLRLDTGELPENSPAFKGRRRREKMLNVGWLQASGIAAVSGP
jgi:hypothetical protein